MSLFWVLLQKLLPLYLLIFLGFVGGRVLKIPMHALGTLLIYIVGPAVVFTSVLSLPLSVSRLSLPLLFFGLCCTVALTVYASTRRFLKPAHRTILAFATGSGNTGYFGLPMTLYLLGTDYVGLAVLCAAGFILYENSLGFYLASRGKYSTAESVIKVVRLPTIYALLAGVVGNFAGLRLAGPWAELSDSFRGAYTVVGMLLIGLGTGTLRSWKINPRFFATAFFVKFLVWPALIWSTLKLDSHFFHFYDSSTHRLAPLMAVVPLPAIAVAVASLFETAPEETSVVVMASTLFSLFYIPFVIGFLSF